jgi:hypothetical protein
MRRVPYLVSAVSVALILLAVILPPTAYSERPITFMYGVWAAACVLVGGLIAALRNGNAVGWVMLGSGALLSAGLALGGYAGYALLRDPSLPLGTQAAWITGWIYNPALGGVVILLLIFPRGHLDGRLRTWSARACIAATLLLTIGQALVPGKIDGFGDVRNPFAVSEHVGVVHGVTSVSATVLFVSFAFALVNVFVRLFASRGEEHEQLKWFAYAVTLVFVGILVNALPLGLDDSWFGLILIVAALVSVPLSVAVAIFRHRLYDIDVVINRTLVYGGLTAVLVATYLVFVLALRTVLAPVTGESDLAVAASTLAVAALFRPLRNRIQTIVDQRFYRRRYDAARTLEAFAGRMRRQLDLEAVGSDLRHTVDDTVQPASVSLWLRSQEVSR